MDEIYYSGIDPSLTGTGFIILNSELEIVHDSLITTGSKTPTEERIIWIVENIFEEFNRLPLDNSSTHLQIAVEGLSMGSQGQSVLELAGLHYHLRILLLSTYENIPLIVPPTTLKKFVCGKGNARKEQMLLQCYKKFGAEFSDNNRCDAYCLARYLHHKGQK